VAKARKRGKRSTGARRPPRIVSRPAVLPLQKDTATRTLLSGLDTLADHFRRDSEDRATWKMKKGDARSIWVVHLRVSGEWDWEAINSVAHRIEGLRTVYKDISDKRLAFARLEYTQYDRDGNKEAEGWFAPSPLTTWDNLVKTLQEESDVRREGSYARRYENSHIHTIAISFASRVP